MSLKLRLTPAGQHFCKHNIEDHNSRVHLTLEKQNTSSRNLTTDNWHKISTGSEEPEIIEDVRYSIVDVLPNKPVAKLEIH